MLENLYDIPWAKLEHAYGSAADVPELIKALATKDKELREAALWKLYGNIFHQGSRYEASPYAIPFIFELLEHPETEGKSDLVYYLLALAMGYEEECLPSGFNPYEYRAGNYAEVQRWKKSGDAEMISYHQVVQDCYDRVLDGIDHFLALAGSTDKKLALASIYALAFFPEAAAQSVDRILGVMDDFATDGAKATAIIALYLITNNTKEAVSFKFEIEEYLEGNSPILRAAAIVALKQERANDKELAFLKQLTADEKYSAVEDFVFFEGGFAEYLRGFLYYIED
jgi:hypothetical protein